MTDRPDFAPPPDAAPDSPPPPDAALTGRAATASGERTHPASPLVRLWLIVVAFGWFVLNELIQGERFTDVGDVLQLVTSSWAIAGLAVVLVLGLGFGWWGWWTTTFHVTDDEFRIENSGAFAESKRIAYQRIQSVDINQPLAARMLGLAQLSVDVGGGESTQLAYLTRRRAGELRAHLMARAHGVRTATSEVPHAASSAWDDTSAGDRILVRLNPGEIILGAVASLELILMIVTFVTPLVLGLVLGQPLLALGGLVPLGLAIWSYLAKRVLGQFNYTLAQTPTGLRITRGLTTLASQTVPPHRVQAIQVSQPLLWRFLGRYRIDVTILGASLGADSSGDVSSSTLLLPIGNAQQVATAFDAVWPGLRLDDIPIVLSPARARWLEPLAAGWNGFGYDEHVVVARHGWFTRTSYVVPHARLQSVALEQGPLDRRTDVADVALHTTNLLSGARIVHADAATARALVFDEMARARTARMEGLLQATPTAQRVADPLSPDAPAAPQPSAQPVVGPPSPDAPGAPEPSAQPPADPPRPDAPAAPPPFSRPDA